MALATQCPHCQTTFRVAHDQLKLRAGLVRCGACKQIFNGIEHLLRPDASTVGATPAPAPPAPVAVDQPAATPEWPALTLGAGTPVAAAPAEAPPPPPPATTDDVYPGFDLMEGETPDVPLRESASASAAPASATTAPATPSPELVAPAPIDSTDPLQRMTLMHFTYDDERPVAAPVAPGSEQDFVIPLRAPSKATQEVPAPDEVDQALDHLQRQPWRTTTANTASIDDDEPVYDTAVDEPSFVTHGRRRQLLGRSLRTWLVAGCMLLAVAALIQSLFVFRNQIAARVPAARPWLEQACSALDCSIELLAQASAVSIESNELVAIDPARNRYALNLLLRNSSDLPQRWPSIELTLLDASDRPVVRRVFSAGEYLQPAPDSGSGFAPNSERSARVAFELQQKKASNYRVYLFYP